MGSIVYGVNSVVEPLFLIAPSLMGLNFQRPPCVCHLSQTGTDAHPSGMIN